MQDDPRLVRIGTVTAEEQLETLLALKPACARSSLLAHRTGEVDQTAREKEGEAIIEVRS